ncbi:DUF4212 domain-containing protein [Roseomonas genomospecies 6]|nr:DUF4212 domain-containing protein [Roseomonas genomospecies 6]
MRFGTDDQPDGCALRSRDTTSLARSSSSLNTENRGYLSGVVYVSLDHPAKKRYDHGAAGHASIRRGTPLLSPSRTAMRHKILKSRGIVLMTVNSADSAQTAQRNSYWQASLRLIMFCLVIWFVVSYGFGILLVDQLNAINLGGFKLGFWFAQQGSIYIFVALIFFYAMRMNVIDRQHDVHED